MNEEESRAKDESASAPDPAEVEEGEKRRKRPRLTLRIPDDDVKREAVKPPDFQPPEEKLTPIAATPIIPLGEVTGPDAEHLRQSSRPPPAPPDDDDDKTPLVPPVREPTASEEGIDVAVEEDVLSTRDAEVITHDTLVALPPVMTGEVPAVTAEAATAALEKPKLVEAAPSKPPPPRVSQPAPLPESKLQHLSEPPRAPAAAIVDDEEAVPIESDRESTLPLDPEDLVSVEAVPQPPKVPANLQTATAQTRTTLVDGQPRSPTSKPAPAAGRAPLVIVPSHATTPSPLAPQDKISSEASAARKRGRPWWEDMFNDDFVRTMAKITDEQIAREVDFIEDSLGVAKGGALMDVACGTGRHAIELSRRGYQMVGYDLSLAMLARAADEAQDREQKLNFVHGDMREMTFEETFDGVFCWNTSFGFFEEEKNAQVIQRVHRSLRTGGQFLLDVINRDHVAQTTPSLVWFEGDACICMDEMVFDFITSRMKVKRTMMLDDGRTREIDYSIRIYSLHELGKLLHDHGFRVAEVSGNCATPGVYFGGTSTRTIILAEKR